MLNLANIAKAYGTKTLFEDVTLFVQRADRLGLVGPNGAGKSTLFNIILGTEEPDQGTISWERGSFYGFLPQESAPIGDETPLEIATASSQPDPDDHDIDYTLEPRAKKILAGLGFRQSDFDRPAKVLSGGWIMRAHLARLLVEEPDLLLLDEPTNHLDIEALEWFQNYLKTYPGGLVIISHDRAFLNALCTGILELRNQTLYRWNGNYDAYLELKVASEAQIESTYKSQQREIAHLQKFVDRFGAKATLASRAKSREKQIAKLKQTAIDAPQGDAKTVHFKFPQPARSGHDVIKLENIHQAYGEHKVYAGLNLALERGERIVLVGPNGAGKSTLLKLLADVIPYQQGSRKLGTNVDAGYFSQNRLDNLDPKNTVMNEALSVRDRNPSLHEQLARNLLGSFLFSGDDVHKPVEVLSGGEKTRLALVKILLAPPNLLLMDEPTTHLDIPSIDALASALESYTGTLVFISHDVYFIRALAKRVLHVHAGVVTPYAGGYDYYLERTRSTNARAALTAGLSDGRPDAAAPARPNKSSSHNSGYKTKEQKRAEAEARKERKIVEKRLEEAEAKVLQLEEKQAKLAAQLEAPSTYEDTGKAVALNRELENLVTQIKKATHLWEALTEELERFP